MYNQIIEKFKPTKRDGTAAAVGIGIFETIRLYLVPRVKNSVNGLVEGYNRKQVEATVRVLEESGYVSSAANVDALNRLAESLDRQTEVTEKQAALLEQLQQDLYKDKEE